MNKTRMIAVFLMLLSVGCFAMFFVTRSNQEYLVIFDSNGGSIVENQKIKYHKKIIKPNDPVRQNYTFQYWQKNGVEYNFDTLIEENTLLTASWKENISYLVKITLDGVGYEAHFYEGEVINLDNFVLPSKDGYKITLYNNNVLYDLQAPITTDLNLQAQYEKID